MGVTLSSKRVSVDMGYAGFSRFRKLVAHSISPKLGEEYGKMSGATFWSSEKQIEYIEQLNTIMKALIDENKVSEGVLNFLFESDCDGEIKRKPVKEVYELIKDQDDELVFGYVGRPDCARMRDLKKLFSDNTKVEWY